MKFKKYLLLFPALLTLLISIANNTIIQSEAFSFNVCGHGLGVGLDSKKISSSLRESESSLASVGNRTYTVDELFSNSYENATPYGLIEKGDWFFGENKEITKDITITDEAQKNRLIDQGTKSKQLNGCTTYSLGTMLSNLSTSVGQWLSNIIKALSVSLFSNDFVCNPDSKNKFCIDLIGIVGGKDNTDKSGLISTLGTGIFIPLQVLAFVLVALWIFYKGIIKREFRASLGGLLWAFFTLVLGMIVILNPYTFARMPQKINSAVGDCLLGALTGSGCNLTGSRSSSNPGTVCDSYSTTPGSSGNSLALKLNGLSCGITKAFTINRWSYQQFGYSFDELWTSGAPAGYTNYPSAKLQGKPEDYCVNTHSVSAPSEIGTSPNMSGDKKCNIALAFLANKTQGDYGNKATLKDVVLTASKDDTMWNAFTGQSGRTALSGIFSNLGILLASIAFIPVTVFAHAYSLTSTIMLAFAPLFFLFGLHPGKGKKIFLGWLETEVGYILKYLASAMLTIVMILIFGTTLAKMNAFSALVSIIILDCTFIMYRKEFINLIGTVNMGGIKVANKAEEAMNKMGDNASQYSKAALGGAVGGAMLAGSKAMNGELTGGAKQVIGEIAKGAGQGLGMEARRGNGVVATATRQFKTSNDQLKNKRKRDLEEKARTQTEQQNKFNDKKAEILDSANDKELNKKLSQSGLNNLKTDLDGLKVKISKVNNPEDKDKLTKLETELNVKMGHNIKLAKAVEETGDISKGLSIVGNSENDKALNRTGASVDNLINKLETLKSQNAITNDQFKHYSDIARNIQEKSMNDVNIKFQDDLIKSNKGGVVDAEAYHKAWSNHENGKKYVADELEKLHTSAEKAINTVYSQKSAGNSNINFDNSITIQNALNQFERVYDRTKDAINVPNTTRIFEQERVILTEHEANKELNRRGNLPKRK